MSAAPRPDWPGVGTRYTCPPPSLLVHRSVPLNWDLISIRRRDVDGRAARPEDCASGDCHHVPARRYVFRWFRRHPVAQSHAPRYLRRASTRIGQPGERILPLTVPPLYAQYRLSDYCASGRQSSNSAAYSVINRSTFCASRRNAVADNESNLLSIWEGAKGNCNCSFCNFTTLRQFKIANSSAQLRFPCLIDSTSRCIRFYFLSLGLVHLTFPMCTGWFGKLRGVIGSLNPLEGATVATWWF